LTNQEKVAGDAASKLISERIAELGDWRGETLAAVRALSLLEDKSSIYPVYY